MVTPSTTRATPSPKVSSMVSSVSPVSSTASWRSAAATVCSSRPSSATIVATAMGCVMYGSPERRNWPSWAPAAVRPAATIMDVSSSGR